MNQSLTLTLAQYAASTSIEKIPGEVKERVDEEERMSCNLHWRYGNTRGTAP